MLLRVSVVLWCLFLLAGCARTNRSEFAIYDWEAQRSTAGEHGVNDLVCAPEACPDPRATHVYVLGAPKLTTEDVDRETVRAARDPAAGAVLLFRFTTAGERKFKQLVRTLDDREAESNQSPVMLVVIDSKVYASPVIDFRTFPQGVPVDNGIQMSVASMNEARELAKALRGD